MSEVEPRASANRRIGLTERAAGPPAGFSVASLLTLKPRVREQIEKCPRLLYLERCLTSSE